MKKTLLGIFLGGMILLGVYSIKIWSENGYAADTEENNGMEEIEFEGEYEKELIGPVMSESTFRRMKERRKKREKIERRGERFLNNIQAFTDLQFERRRKKSLWVDGKRAHPGDFFVQKLELSPGDSVEFFTDIHADVDALYDWRDYAKEAGKIDGKGKLVSPNDYTIYMGDFVDREDEGIKVLKFLIRQKFRNPDQVILFRGNHAEEWIFKRYGFADELKKEYGFDSQEREDVYELFDYLPSACILVWKNDDGKKRALWVVHGGFPSLENYSPKRLLESDTAIYEKLEGGDNIKNEAKKKNVEVRSLAGRTREFAWGDFHVNPNEKTLYKEKRLSFQRGKDDTEGYLRKLSEQTGVEFLGIIRGHQHSENFASNLKEGNGFAFLWGKRQWRGRGRFLSLAGLVPFVLTIAPFNYSLLEEEDGILSGEAPLCTLKITEGFQDCVLELDKQKER